MKTTNKCNFADDSIRHVAILNELIEEYSKTPNEKTKLISYFVKFNYTVNEYKCMKIQSDTELIIDDFRNRAKNAYLLIIKNTFNITDINDPIITYGFNYITNQIKEIKRHLNINQQTKRK